MTNEEAIEHLKNMKMPFDLYFESGKEEIRIAIENGNKSLDIAIKSLKNQIDNDLISREELIRKLKAWDNKANGIPNYVWKVIKELNNE